ncbi:hypothetical protein NQ317_010762 [Molorchus minor]|uniref:Uncharacterized protein n=1 Tax=Molorchus minor TaxID=1323400 RepID=A0ABQ9IQ03_9CUCU|nr:hypothetical protein NQ317_010762 [Molorchus minor]
MKFPKKRCISLIDLKIMGSCIGACKTSTDELIYYVYGRKLNFHFPDYDGRNAAYAATSSNMVY